MVSFARRFVLPAEVPPKIKTLFLIAALLVLYGRPVRAAAPGCVGFAAVDGDLSQGMSIAGGTVGGAGGTTVTVSTQAALDAAAAQAGPYVIQISGMIPLTPFGHKVDVASNKTIVGLGCGSGILYGGFSMDGVSNVILQGLVIGESYQPDDPGGACCNDDAILITNLAHHVWVDHCEVYHSGDGLLDITQQANYVTVSWCKFHDHNKVSTIGHSNSNTVDSGYLKVTYHHNWFEGVNQSGPRFRFGMAHLFNNFYRNVSTYCVFNTMAGEMVLEANNFGVTALNPHVIGTPTPAYPPLLSASGNLYDATATGSTDTFGSPFNPATFYAYSLNSAASVPTMAVTGTGPCGYQATPTFTPSLPATVVWRVNAGGSSYLDGGGHPLPNGTLRKLVRE
jgi:pectate lyase